MELRVDGKRVFAATGGRAFDPSPPVVIFIHGAGFDHTAWQLQARYFAHHGRAVLALDLPGHGRSEGPVLGSIDESVDWLVPGDAISLEAHPADESGCFAARVVEARHQGEITLATLRLAAAGGAPLQLTLAGRERLQLVEGARVGIRIDLAQVHVMPLRARR